MSKYFGYSFLVFELLSFFIDLESEISKKESRFIPSLFYYLQVLKNIFFLVDQKFGI